MFVHVVHVRRIAEESRGTRLEAVVCEKCQTSYWYELTRVSVGKAWVLYGLYEEAARRRAKMRADQNLQWRLASEAELVPCPKCRWVNQPLVDKAGNTFTGAVSINRGNLQVTNIGATSGIPSALGENGTINLGSGKEIRIQALADEVIRVVGRPDTRIEHDEDRPGDVIRLCADTTSAKALLGFEPSVGLRAGLHELKEWYVSLAVPPQELLGHEVVRNWITTCR